ncbi:MAG: gliding motility-associated C-terminal domain-containing protein [Bacteroidetes bacterium]|nr:gliding motility-associated C-terminal domain-containing protein [Bacteroidota bacterium]
MKKILTLLFLFGFLIKIQAQISGTIFRDYNGDGIQQAAAPYNEPGIQGVIINAYDKSNLLLNTTLSGPTGTYSLPFTDTVRVEFEIPPNNTCFTHIKDYSSYLPNGENIRFVYAATNNLNFSIQNPAEYFLFSPIDAFVTRFNRGDPLVPGPPASGTALFGHPYKSGGNGFVSPMQLTAAPVGAIWGMAYSKHAKKLFATAFVKRFAGLGPLGTGGIYMLEPNGASFTVTNFYDMDANGHRTRAAAGAVPFGLGSSFTINMAGTLATYLGPIDPVSGAPEGLGVVGVNGVGGRELTNVVNGTWNDPSAMAQACKVGLGDIDISDDGRFLFLTNLYDRKIYRLELDNVMNPQTVVAVTSYSLPNIPVTNGVLRPFGLCNHFGKIYIGVVSTGENGGQNIVNGVTDLYAYMLEMTDPTGNPTINPVPVFTLPLNYQKGSAGPMGSNKWYPWNDNTAVLQGGGEMSLPTPVFSDIGFNQRGDLIIDLMDRSGHQFCYGGKRHLTGNTNVAYVIGGDLLIAGFNCGTGAYSIENNGSYVSNGTTYNGWGIGNNQGIGGGEFFHDMGESEGSVGAVAMIPKSDSFIAAVMNPIGLLSNGTGLYTSNNGVELSGLRLAGTPEFGKGNSMGDVELAGDAPLLEIGNRIWKDTDADGIQDANEFGINNVEVLLFADFNNDMIPDGPPLGTTVTSGDGQYAFNAAKVLDGDPVTPASQAGPVANRLYLIQISTSDWTGGQGINDLQGHRLTLSDIGGAGQPDVRDNDALLVGTIPTIQVKTGINGENEHSKDFGFINCLIFSLSDITLNCIDTAALIGPNPIAGNTYLWDPPNGLSDINIAQPYVNTGSTTTYTLTINGNCKYPQLVTVDQTPPPADAGPNASINCSTQNTQIGTAPLTGYTYHWEPAISLDNPNSAQPIASPKSTTTYTLTVTGANGCTSQSYCTVLVNECCTKIVIPNSFSPNGDLLNDQFGVIEIENLRAFTLSIYNRWGQKLFETKTKDLRWDGTFRGVDCEVGTYFYICTYECATKEEKFQLQGDISLIR